jgi:DNA invertase Pin-like site-specific DNA recombinase
MKYGYGRVSTVMQDTRLQEDAFQRAGVDQVVTEKWSGVGARPRLQALIARLVPGDEVIVYKLDRLGRSLQDLLLTLERMNAAGAAFRSLTEPIDTRTPAGKLMFSMLGAVAEFERSLIRERVVAGQVAAYRRGVKFGRRRTYTHEQEKEMFARWVLGARIKDIAEDFGCATATVHRFIASQLGEKERVRLPVLGPLLEVERESKRRERGG